MANRVGPGPREGTQSNSGMHLVIEDLPEAIRTTKPQLRAPRVMPAHPCYVLAQIGFDPNGSVLDKELLATPQFWRIFSNYYRDEP
jgi:hypothetical protein